MVGRGAMRVSAAVTFGATAVLCAACSTAASTATTDVWRDPSYAAGPMTNMVVFGGRLDETNRRTLEDGFVSALSAHGVHATQSYRLFPGELPSNEAAQRELRRLGVDGVLVATMKGRSERETYVPGAYYGGFWTGFYGPGWGGVWDPGYTVTDTFVKFETSLWDPRGEGKMVWSAVTQTKNPSSGRDFATSLTKTVIPLLVRSGFSPPGPEDRPRVVLELSPKGSKQTL
jgi:hypothetical protein